jgi:glutamate dehydrogenase
MDSGEAKRRRLIGAARRLLSGESTAAALSGDLFQRASVEDLADYTAPEIAGFARSAASLLAERRLGRHLVRLTDAPVAHGQGVTLVEILNDNMPFLVDSVMAELQAFGAGIRLVAHPIVTVRRDRKGALVAYLGTGAADKRAIRESLIQVHVDRLMIAAERETLVRRLDETLTEVARAVED